MLRNWRFGDGLIVRHRVPLLRQAKVHQPEPFLDRVVEEVGRFDVSMNDPEGVNMTKGKQEVLHVKPHLWDIAG